MKPVLTSISVGFFIPTALTGERRRFAVNRKTAFSSDERSELERKLQLFLRDELGHDLCRFDAGFLLDFIDQHIGPAFYNRGVYDAQAILESQIEQIRDDVLGLEKPLPDR